MVTQFVDSGFTKFNSNTFPLQHPLYLVSL